MNAMKTLKAAGIAVVMGLAMVGCSSAAEDKVDNAVNKTETEVKDAAIDAKADAEKAANKVEEAADDVKEDTENAANEVKADAQAEEAAIESNN